MYSQKCCVPRTRAPKQEISDNKISFVFAGYRFIYVWAFDVPATTKKVTELDMFPFWLGIFDAARYGSLEHAACTRNTRAKCFMTNLKNHKTRLNTLRRCRKVFKVCTHSGSSPLSAPFTVTPKTPSLVQREIDERCWECHCVCSATSISATFIACTARFGSFRMLPLAVGTAHSAFRQIDFKFVLFYSDTDLFIHFLFSISYLRLALPRSLPVQLQFIRTQISASATTFVDSSWLKFNYFFFLSSFTLWLFGYVSKSIRRFYFPFNCAAVCRYSLYRVNASVEIVFHIGRAIVPAIPNRIG